MIALDFLRSMVDAVNHEFHGVEATITIELPRKDAERFLYNLSRELHDNIMVRSTPDAPSVSLGSVFKYSGHNFRIVEKV